jgi:dTDP-4-dehydrorhamnose 3,5-epimerase
MKQSEIFIIGSNGQLGTALRAQYLGARTADIDELDITNPASIDKFNWDGIKIILNAAAYTNVDGAETPEGRVAAWKVNVTALSYIAKICLKNDITLLHLSSDYVFDGSAEVHTEEESFGPLGVYGQTKAAGDAIVSVLPKHYVVRTSWVIGSGQNFVRSIYGLGQRSISPKVVADQFGRLTFTDELVRVIDHLLVNNLPYGTYNVTNDGPVGSWADIARCVYEYAGYKDLTVGDTTAEEYFAGKISSPRPVYSTLDMTKLHATGFKSRDWKDNLKEYIEKDLK